MANPCPHHTTSLILVGMFLSLVPALAGDPGRPQRRRAQPAGALLDVHARRSRGAALHVDVPVGWVLGGVVAGMLGILFAVPGLYLMSPWQRLYDREPVKDAPLSRNQWWLVYLVVGAIGAFAGSWTANAWL